MNKATKELTVLQAGLGAVDGLFVVYEGDTRFDLAVKDDVNLCSCNKENCVHLIAVKEAIAENKTIFSELVIEDDESDLWIYKTNAPTPVDTLQFEPKTSFWFNDVSLKYVFKTPVDAILNRRPTGICAGFVSLYNVCEHGMITDIEFDSKTRHYKFWFDHEDRTLECEEDEVLPIS